VERGAALQHPLEEEGTRGGTGGRTSSPARVKGAKLPLGAGAPKTPWRSLKGGGEASLLHLCEAVNPGSKLPRGSPPFGGGLAKPGCLGGALLPHEAKLPFPLNPFLPPSGGPGKSAGKRERTSRTKVAGGCFADLGLRP
jgi:hypothetical protein